MRKFYKVSLLLILFMPVIVLGQTSFLGLDGGFEGAATIDNAGSSAGPTASKWTRAGTVSTIAAEIATVRSGSKSMKISSTSTTLARIWSPTYTIASSSAKWFVQYYRRSASITNTQTQQFGNIRGGAEQSNGTYTTVTAANTWEKVSYAPTTTTAATTVAGVILNKSNNATGGDVFIDDFTIYSDVAVDNTAPNSPASIAIANPTATTLDVSWGAAPGGVDGGGYLVVRYAANPAAADDPNINGIYASGNTVPGSISGTVVYQGTGLSFTDIGLTAATTYYYKVYTYDKAYNYSAETQGSAPTATTCIAPDRIEFLVQPSNVAQDVNMTTVTVRAYCNATGSTATAYTRNITLTASNNGCGYISQTFAAVNGVATFSTIKFTRSAQTGITLTASAAIAPDKISNTFDVTAPGGTPVPTTLLSENFEGATVWGYAAGVPIVVGSGGTSGTDVVAIKTFSGNKALVKSYSVDNSSGEKGTTNTITFNNQLIAASYDHAVFSFQLASLEPGAPFSGAGVDNGENMLVEVNLNGSGVWNKVLTYFGNGNYTFPFSNSPVDLLTYNANVSYVKASTQSAFSIQLPDGTTQFQFRVTATNNRSNENWGIDNITLVGLTNTPGITNPLPSVTNDNLMICPNSNTTITVVTSNTTGAVGYSWLNSGGNTNFISNAAISNPVVNPPAAEVYTATITDGDGCKASGTFTLTIPGGAVGTWAGTNNSDWFECKNWGGGVVPLSTTNVTIPFAALNVADIDPLSSYAAFYGGVANANNITIDNKILSTQANAILTVAGNLTIQNSGSLIMTNGGQVNLNGSWSKIAPSVFTAGTGTINYAGSTPQTIAPENYYNLSSSSTGTRTLSPTGTIGVASILSPGTNIYTVANSTVDFNGSIDQNIPGLPTAAAAPYVNQYNILKTSTGGIKTLTSSFTILDNLTIGDLTTLELSNSLLTLKSDASATARIAPIGSGQLSYSGTGKFNIERFIPLGGSSVSRRWRLLSPPVAATGALTIKASWQENSTNGVLNSPVDPAPGYGTTITKTTVATNGFDIGTTATPSIRYLDNTGTWSVPTATDGSDGKKITDYPGYMLFVRGDRSIVVSNQYINTTANANLRVQGKITRGDTTMTYTGTVAGQNLIFANPYASAIDMHNVTMNGTKFSSLGTYYRWDPKLNGSKNVGGWVSFFNDGSGNLYPSTTAGSLYPTSGRTGIVESGEAFMVLSPAAGNVNVTVHETDKDNSSTTIGIASKPTEVNYAALRTDLFYVYPDGKLSPADGAATLFGANMHNEVDAYDAPKVISFNTAEKISLWRDDSLLSIETRKKISENDTVYYRISKLKTPAQYQLSFGGTDFEKKLVGVLEDKFTGKSTLINIDADNYLFKTTEDKSSISNDRFKLVFRQVVKYTNIRGEQQNEDIAVSWTVNDETYIRNYEVEKSDDGVNFTKIATSQPVGKLDYTLFDVHPVVGKYYYRIKTIGTNGAFAYSDIVKVKMMSTKAPMYVFPNPVTNGNIGLQFNSQAAGKYGVRLLNALGQVVLSKQLVHGGGTASHNIAYVAAAGSYQLEVTAPNKKQTVLKVQLIQ